MLTTTLSDFSKNIKSYFDQVTEALIRLLLTEGKIRGY
jgi:hypothetical protein